MGILKLHEIHILIKQAHIYKVQVHVEVKGSGSCIEGCAWLQFVVRFPR